MANLVPNLVSPQAHRRIDLLTFPVLIGLTAWLARRNPPAASLVALTAATEAATFLTTDFPPGVLPWMSFRDHVRVGLIMPAGVAALAFLFKDIRPADRRIVLAMLAVPLALNALSDDSPRGTR